MYSITLESEQEAVNEITLQTNWKGAGKINVVLFCLFLVCFFL